MKLEKFSKNKTQKKLVISAIIGLILLVDGITLYRTFALYEEKKEFNVLRGKVPDFAKDIKFAFLDGETKVDTIPKKEDGKVFVGCECNKEDVKIKWDYANWAPIVLNLNERGTSCTLKFETGNSISNVSVGDYISYTPSLTNYTIIGRLTGCPGSGTYPCPTINQNINPSELNLWRVIRKNGDGTIEIVSEYASSSDIYFYGTRGYEQFVGSLNRIAEQYETEGITVGSRHMGYNGQTEGIIVSTPYTNPWNDNTDSTNSPNGSDREKNGGGDYGYVTDYDLVQTAIGTTVAKKNGTETPVVYWLASRLYGAGWYTHGRAVGIDGSVSASSLYFSYTLGEVANYCHVRPIVVLNSKLKVVEGTMNDKPLWTIN